MMTDHHKGGKPEEEKPPIEEADSSPEISVKSKHSITVRKKLITAFHSTCRRKPKTTEKDTHEDGTTNRAFHPFFCRLHETEGFSVTSPDSLINAGFASIALALFTIFRPTPFFLCTILLDIESVSMAQTVNRAILLCIMWLWLALLLTVFFFLGALLVVSRHVTKRHLLLLHPWGLLLLYVDVFIWLFITIAIHAETDNWREVRPAFLDAMGHPVVFFLFIYFEILCFGVLYYLYATFFIAAELTIIERFYHH